MTGRFFIALVCYCALLSQTGTAQSNGSAGVPGSVQGRVTDGVSGNGIGGATLHLFPRNMRGSNGQESPSAASFEDGSFRFDSVSPGTYVLAVNHPNYRNASGRSQTLSVSDGQQLTDVAIQMSPLATVSGRVLDSEGHPAAGASVELFTTYNSRGRIQLRRGPTATANKAGEYLIRKVNPGRYYLAATATDEAESADKPAKEAAETAPLSSVRTFSPKALTIEGASLIEAVAGSDVSGADVRLQRAAVFHIRGKVETLIPGALQSGATVSLAPRDSVATGGLEKSLQTPPNGTFDFDGVLPGSYTLWLLGSYAPGIEQNRRTGRRRLLAHLDIDVNASDMSGIVLSLMPPINLSGQVLLSNPPPNANLAQMRINLQPAGQVRSGNFQSIAVSANGSFSVQDMEPGEYMVRAMNAPTGTYVQSVTYNRQDVLTSGIDLAQGGAGEIQVVLRGGAAEVDGSIVGSSANQTISGSVILIPETMTADASGLLMANLMQGGTFSIRNVAPGRYYAAAVERWTSIWQNVDFLREMERAATAVDVGENGHAQIQLPLLTLDQLQSTASVLGLSVQ
ncbi:MAG: carboxypeptidase regulatory-like domain-containing protein [Acidobacteriota bacterium]|nr:carboxypeptidase regulatory-like domain-containing protein [Acidobacteriota bacterium]